MSGFGFTESVQDAITESLQFGKVLVVYGVDISNDDSWIQSWFHPRMITDKLLKKSVWLKIVQGTHEFTNFKELFPSIQTPSLYFIKDQQIQMVIHGESGHGNFSHWNRVVDYLESTNCDSPNINEQENTPEMKNNEDTKETKKTFKEEVNDLTQKIYQQEVMKQKKLERKERERILRLVQADKQERKDRELSQKQIVDDISDEEIIEVVPTEVNDNIKKSEKYENLKDCKLLIKLTNSDSLKNTFDSDKTLRDVRDWVDENRTDGTVSYLFHRNVPRVTFSPEDESKSLTDLELTPRSVLILDPCEEDLSAITNSGVVGKILNKLWFWRSSPSIETQISNSDTNQQAFPESSSESPIDTDSSYPEANNEQRFESPGTFPYITQITENSSSSNLANNPESNDSKKTKKDDKNDRPTYNGNNLNLESKKDD
ncbi:hypothetical protein Kpol_1066p12 [Vanderwaltozyma polyspora DSM 70294]|uniref:UBX domain-containing protein n=1 Tax=Vanderwaltozyma polyspora (strain ATCC 22028 / DSM 70294 / BCRC 21397 / CBS 2163 / NBRC 10782 / NRRL Y-8283 / UCD 57-17) TaxID=436907 RepID=A7TMN4_VANPO|nr:uncharacterized protein Kpol_1066p12 [Vanderwaltozyma polyspora DSM 70294]EDO16448.1 hypothetical protein Kpol_1066p12 [Vanderwaltozyma polyspora DSM 70294]